LSLLCWKLALQIMFVIWLRQTWKARVYIRSDMPQMERNCIRSPNTV
jgi:hypothetical protein